MIFYALDVRQDGVLVALLDQAHGDAGHRGFDWHTSIHESQGATADAGHRGGAVGGKHLGHEADGIGKLLLVREHRQKGPFGQSPMSNVPATGTPQEFGFAGGIG